MTLAHVNKYYLESNLMAAPPSSQLDSLYADLQVHALSVSDGFFLSNRYIYWFDSEET